MGEELFKTKICRKCGKEKCASEFNVDRNNKNDGLQTYCRACSNEYGRQWNKKTVTKPNNLSSGLYEALSKKKKLRDKIEAEIKGIELAIKTLEKYC